MFLISVLLISICLLGLYIFRLFKILKYWEDEQPIIEDIGFFPQVSVVIAGRNEELYLDKCLQSVFDQNYPQEFLEVIFVNDGSDDGTLAIAEEYLPKGLNIINLTASQGKKNALHSGISSSSHGLLLLTDADSVVGQEWIRSMVAYFVKHDLDLLSGPIRYEDKGDWISRFQVLDGVNNMATTLAGILSQKYYLANGANLMYTKKLYQKIGGLSESVYASGDDVFMIHKAANSGAEIGYIKHTSAIVDTANEMKWENLKEQRKRWASKTKGYPQMGLTYLQGGIWIFVVWIVGLFFSSIIVGYELFVLGVSMLVIKWLIDYIYLKRLTVFFNHQRALGSFLPVSILYVVYILYTGCQALFPSRYQWKGRTTN